MLSFQVQVEIFALLQDKQVSQIISKLATKNLCSFLSVIGFCWKRHVDQNENSFLENIVLGSYKIILFAGERDKQRSIGESLVRVRVAGLKAWQVAPRQSLHFLISKWGR